MITTKQAAQALAIMDLFVRSHPELIDRLEDRVTHYESFIEGKRFDQLMCDIIDKTIEELKQNKEIYPKGQNITEQQLRAATRQAESKINRALQELHTTTGLIPSQVNFDAVDISNYQEAATGQKRIQVSNVEVIANT